MRLAAQILSLASVFCLAWGLRTLQLADREQPSKNVGAGELHSIAEKHPRDFVGTIVFPTLHSSLNVFSGDIEINGKRGPVWLEGSSGLGSSGNAVLAGHRDTHFRLLKDLRIHDEIVIENGSGQFRYRVQRVQIVLPTDRRLLRRDIGSSLTLVTCYPFWFVGSAPKRYIVQAGLVAGPAVANN